MNLLNDLNATSIWIFGIILPLLYIKRLISVQKLVELLLYTGILILNLAWIIYAPGYEPVVGLVVTLTAIFVDRKIDERQISINLIQPDKPEKEYKPLENLEINIWKAYKAENIFAGEPLSDWALILSISNKSQEIFYIDQLRIVFVFRPYRPFSVKDQIIDSFAESLFKSKVDRWYRYGFFLHEPRGSSALKGIRSINSLMTVEKAHPNHIVVLCDWENLGEISIAPLHFYCSPRPNDKAIWFLFGEFPEQISHTLIANEVYLDSMEMYFYTDQGNANVKCEFSQVDYMPEEIIERIDAFWKRQREG